MTGRTFGVLLAFALLPAAVCAQQPRIQRETLVGAWQDAPDVGSGYGELYVLRPGGRLEHRISSGDCTSREQASYGTWSFERGTLVVRITRRRVLVGGQLVANVPDEETGCTGRRRLDGATPENRGVVPPRILRIELAGLRYVRDRNGAPTLVFGARRFYRIGGPDDVQG